MCRLMWHIHHPHPTPAETTVATYGIGRISILRDSVLSANLLWHKFITLKRVVDRDTPGGITDARVHKIPTP